MAPLLHEVLVTVGSIIFRNVRGGSLMGLLASEVIDPLGSRSQKESRGITGSRVIPLALRSHMKSRRSHMVSEID